MVLLHRAMEELHPEPPSENPPVTLKKPEMPILSETDVAILGHLATAVTTLSEFPSGLHFPDRIFYCTGERATNKYGQPGMRIAIVDNAGEMTMVEAYEQNDYGIYVEWDLTTAIPMPMTSRDIHCYAIPLLNIMLKRLKEVKFKDAIKSKDAKTAWAVREDIIRIRTAKKAISDLLAGNIAKPAEPRTTAE